MKSALLSALFGIPMLALPPACAAGPAAPTQASAPARLDFAFDYELARLVSQSVAQGQFSEAAIAAIRSHPASAAMVRKMKLKGMDELIAYLRTLPANPKMAPAAEAIQARLGGAAGDGYAPLADEVTRLLRQYVPADFAGRLKVYFIFGGNAGGFAFDDNRNDVYVNLARMSEASTQELAELVAHELFHGVQVQLMPPPPRPAADTPAAALGQVWTRRLLYDLLQEGTAELFTHPLADRPANGYSMRGKARIERNTRRMESIVTMVETIGLRLLASPPRDEDGYEAIYGLLFYGTFDEPAYDLGWVMASTIERHEGKAAVYALLKAEPKRFLLRYQELAQQDPKLPKFSEDFVRAVRAL
ncbi:DUF5700 domain-containing putative Zn-dependent protease [Massilia sp. ST3]|uniref:DUF5700 domain-containing putative Zn-dependent protease n=1 Tax=Massilia sp. ST3 TaxID=2824903 RepID=UPI001B836905|nr:DUF5700 domain-containing putative Zn-dependent protease [Massilia sp. ST3]MBQ5948783.1 hypothetical protein [Massilia sp. ST3]